MAGLAAVGLGFLRRDAILWPLMLASLLLALWGFWCGTRTHGRVGPLTLGVVRAVSLAAGVIVVHGFPAMPMIYGGAALLVAATLWNVLARRAGHLTGRARVMAADPAGGGGPGRARRL